MKNEWTQATMANINWNAHAKAFGAQITGRVHLTKLVHDCLPTNHRINRYDSGQRRCPGCNHKDETRDNILRCNHQGYKNWRESFKTSMQEFHARNWTSPILIHLWNEALDQWFGNDDEIQVAPILFPRDLRLQNLIGWRQIFNERFSTEWARVQEDHYIISRTNDNGLTRKKRRWTGGQWQQKLIQAIWAQWRNLWKHRNELVHGNSAETRLTVHWTNATKELRWIYDFRDQLEPHEQRLFLTELNDHLQRSTLGIRN